MSIQLTKAQLDQIRTEGWDIFSIGGEGDNEEFQIQREDDANIFEFDDDAWKFIVGEAIKGSELHKHVLIYFKENFRDEFNMYTKEFNHDQLQLISL